MKKILLLEDDAKVSAALGARLRHAGYEVLAAPDPGFAMLLATTHAPDLIISDLWMPIMQGFTFARRLKSLGLPNVPVIFITASRRSGLWEEALALGAAGYFEKPYDPPRLLAAVAEILERTASTAAELHNQPANLTP